MPTNADMVCLWGQQSSTGTLRAKSCTWAANLLTVYAPISTDISVCTEVTITSTNGDLSDVHGMTMPSTAAKHQWELKINIDGTADADGATDMEYIGKYDYTVLTANKFKKLWVVPGHTTENLINLLEIKMTFQTSLTSTGGFIIYFPNKDDYGNTIFRNDLGIQHTNEQYQSGYYIQDGHTFPCAYRMVTDTNTNCPDPRPDVTCTLHWGSIHGGSTSTSTDISYKYTEVWVSGLNNGGNDTCFEADDEISFFMEVKNPASHSNDGLPIDIKVISSTDMSDPLNNQADGDTHFNAFHITKDLSTPALATIGDLAFDATTWADNVMTFPIVGSATTANSYIYIELDDREWKIVNRHAITDTVCVASAGDCHYFYEFNSVVYRGVTSDAPGNTLKFLQEETKWNPQNPMVRYHLWEPDPNSTNLRRHMGSSDVQPAIPDATWTRLPTGAYTFANYNEEATAPTNPVAANYPNDQEWLEIVMTNTIELHMDGCIEIEHGSADNTPIPGTCHLTPHSVLQPTYNPIWDKAVLQEHECITSGTKTTLKHFGAPPVASRAPNVPEAWVIGTTINIAC